MLRHISMLILLIAAQLLVVSSSRAAEKMDLETHTLVVEKLRSALKNDLKDIARAPIQLRLADVLAERARLKSNLEVEANCENCKKSREDRKEALELYQSAFSNKKVGAVVDKGAVLMQMAHLHQLLLENSRAARLYEQAIQARKGTYSKNTIANSYLGLADYHFQKGQFAKSKSLYESALKLARPGVRGSIYYRLAWCELNLGQTAKGTSLLKKVLSNPDLLTRETAKGPIFDASFQDDVSRDLATFLARGQVTKKEINQLKELSPERAIKGNIEYLATETDRLGNRKGGLLAWAAFLEVEHDKEERLKAYSRVSRLYVESGNYSQAVASLNNLAKEYRSVSCKSETCKAIPAETRKLIGDWAKLEKRNPPNELLEGYLTYLQIKSDDLEMSYWAAELARRMKKNNTALQLYRQTGELASSKLGKGATEKERKSTQEIFEASLLSEIEIAETLKNKSLRIAAYNNYLKLNPVGAKAWEVKYQLAYIDYESGKVTTAISQFHDLALTLPCKNSLCTKAADLSLDGLVQLKDEARIETYATEYAKAYPAQKAQYTRIARTSVTNQVIRQSKEKNLSPSKASDALTRIQAVSLVGASDSETVANLKLQILLAEKANDLGQVITASNKLAKFKGASKEDKTLATQKLAWAYEMSFNFEKAYQIVRKMNVPRKEESQHALKLAVLAELSGLNPVRHENNYLSLQPRGTNAFLIRTKQVRRSKNPKAEFQKHQAYLSNEIAAQLALEVYARTLDLRFAEKTLLKSKLKRTQATRTLSALLLVKEITAVKNQLARHKIQSTSDAVLSKSLQKRIDLITKMDKLTIEASKIRDWSAETLAISALAEENQRLYNDIMSLPVPKRLKANQKAQYQAAVAAQAAPYARNAQVLKERAEALWAHSDALKVVTEGYEQTPQAYRKPLVARMKALEAAGPRSVRSQISSLLSNSNETVSSRALADARKEAQTQPFNISAIEKLKNLEAKAGRDTMVAYLDGRLSLLKQTGRM